MPWRLLLTGAILMAVSGCAYPLSDPGRRGAGTGPEMPPELAAPPPAPTARAAEEFDTTTTAQRTAASAAPDPAAERELGRTIASLGAPGEAGFWIKTPLVAAAATGRLEYPVTGKSVQVALIPIDGPPTAGSRVSLAALRVLEAPLTGLPELVVYVR